MEGENDLEGQNRADEPPAIIADKVGYSDTAKSVAIDQGSIAEPEPVESHDPVLDSTMESGANDADKTAAESEVDNAAPSDACGQPPDDLHHPLSLSWCFGFNCSLPVHNISEDTRKMIFYGSGHTGVLYDCANNDQCLLQGHSNALSCTAVSGDKRWLATADVGPNCLLIVWDSFSAIPVRTIFEGLGKGCVAVAMSTDAKYVATLSSGSPQAVCIWEWTDERDTPICHTSLSTDYGEQSFVTFHPSDPHQLVTNSDSSTIFYHWKDKVINFHATPVIDKDFNKPIGCMSQTVFVPGSNLGLTGTSEGCGIVWQAPLSTGAEPHVKKAIKLIKMHDSAITVVTTNNSMVVSGDTEGRIKFFDGDLKLLNWYDDVTRFGTLASISFAHLPKLASLKKEVNGQITSASNLYPAESTMSAPKFTVPDFTISTSSATIAHVTTNGTTTDVLFHEHDAAVHALASHPTEPCLLIGGYSCKIKLWDYNKKEVIVVRDFEESDYIQCVEFDPKGEFIGIGFTNGCMYMVDAISLENVCTPFHYSRDTVTYIAFSHDATYMATADLDMCVTVYTRHADCTDQPWQFMAKHRAHYKRIEGLMFGVKLDSDVPRLISLGSDRTMVEYDLSASGEDDLVLLSTERIEQSAVPTAMAWYPALSKESFIAVANDQYKIKLYNSTTKMCRKTLLGPTFGTPLRKLLVLPSPILRGPEGEETRRYLAYITTNKVGLLLLPHSGNPHNSKCLVAHPGLVTGMVCSHDGKYIFTSGGEDCSVNMWTANTDGLEASSLLGGEHLQPFYSMLEGGREGEFFKELEEYFYYAQIRSQGPDTMNRRQVCTTIPIEQIPNVMRAIGFYPSEQEIEDMVNEVKFGQYVDTGANVTDINLEDFIKLYVNHRPAFGLSPTQIGHAFKVVGERMGSEQDWTLPTAQLLTLLQEKGEHLTEVELVEYLMTLMGCSDNPEVPGSFTEDPVNTLQEFPERIGAPMFAEELLGLST